MKIDTLRVLIDWKCNLACSYCCNDIPRFRSQIRPTAFNEIDWSKYKNVCISGGEPLLFPERVEDICFTVPKETFKILYTNGTLWHEHTASWLRAIWINAVNVGLHNPTTFDRLIARIWRDAKDKPYSVRFHVWEQYRDRVQAWEQFGVQFRYRALDDCERPNEDRVVITDWNAI